MRQSKDPSNGQSCQLLQQRLRLLQIARVEAPRKPAVNRSKQFARLLHLALVTPEARKAHGGAQLKTPCLLLLRDGDGGEECFFCRRRIRGFALEQDLAAYAMQESVSPAFAS